MNEEKTTALMYADFDIYHSDKEELTSSKVHVFKPVESKRWLYPDYKRAGFDGLYNGNRSLCGRFQLFDENERVVAWEDMNEHASDKPPTNKAICKNCLKIAAANTPEPRIKSAEFPGKNAEFKAERRIL